MRWHLRAKVALRSPEQNSTFQVVWRQSGDRYDIRLLSTLGIGIARLHGDAGGVTLSSGREADRYAESADQLVEQELGLTLPVTPLRYWLTGRADPAHPALWEDQTLRQADWVVRFSGSSFPIPDAPIPGSQVSGGESRPPDKLTLEHGRIRLRVIVKEWQWL
jgi:outer membrane lipoprotein LolB